MRRRRAGCGKWRPRPPSSTAIVPWWPSPACATTPATSWTPTAPPFLEDIRGKLSFLQSRRAFQFSADYLEGAARGQADENGHFFSKLLLWDEVTGEVVLDYRGGAMRICRDEAVAVALMEPIDRTIREFALAQ